jgi:amino acid transporter
MDEGPKKLKLFDTVCLAFSAFFSIELVASQASLGPSMVFCLLTIGVLYLIGHSMICCELGSTYPDQGGIYVWIDKAYGSRWAARTTWWYWVNVVSFVPCTLVAMIIVIEQVTGITMDAMTISIISILGTWVVVLLNCASVRETKLLSNIGSVLKFFVCIALVIGGFAYASSHGMANEFTAETMIPTFDFDFFMLIPVYIYGLTGMDIISCIAGEMEEPSKNVPRSVAICGVVSVVAYLFSALAVLFVLPADTIDEASGMIDAILVIYGSSQVMIALISVFLVIVYTSYIFSWTIGGNVVAQEAGESGELPAIFAKTNSKHAPVGPALLMGIGSTVLMLIYGATAAGGSELFWTLLAFTSIIFFFPYVILPPALIKLRKIDPDAERPVKIPGKGFTMLVCVLNEIFLAIGIIGYMIPPEGDDPVAYLLSVLGGVVVSQVIGEILLAHGSAESGDGEEQVEEAH